MDSSELPEFDLLFCDERVRVTLWRRATGPEYLLDFSTLGRSTRWGFSRDDLDRLGMVLRYAASLDT